MQDLHKMQIEADQNNTPVQWNTAVKFLMARKFDARRARELYRSHEVCKVVMACQYNLTDMGFSRSGLGLKDLQKQTLWSFIEHPGLGLDIYPS